MTVPGERAHRAWLDREADLHPAIWQIPSSAAAQAVILTAPHPKETPLLLGHPALALDLSKASLPHLFNTCFLSAYDRTPPSEPLHFSDKKNVFQSVDLQVQSGQRTKATPKYTDLPSEGFPVAISQGSTCRSTPWSRSLVPFKHQFSWFHTQAWEESKPARKHPTQTCQSEQSTSPAPEPGSLNSQQDTASSAAKSPTATAPVSSPCSQAQLSAVPTVLLNSL